MSERRLFVLVDPDDQTLWSTVRPTKVEAIAAYFNSRSHWPTIKAAGWIIREVHAKVGERVEL